jgi:hypothetical protein
MSVKLHILLTYNCSLRCKHCYVFSDQRAPGKISLSQISQILQEGSRIPGARWVYFGGGEPFIQYPLLLKGVQRAMNLGFAVGIETNGYFARSTETGIRFLRPLAEMGVQEIRISNDSLHYKNPKISPASNAIQAAEGLGIPTRIVHIPFPDEQLLEVKPKSKHYSEEEPRLMFSGRASETLLHGMETFHPDYFNKCPRNDLESAKRLYIDAYGFVQICPGIAIGNVHERSLDRIVESYKIEQHPILLTLHEEGPSGLIRKTRLNPNTLFVDPCHCCYSARHALIESYPDLLGPHQVYGL